MEDFDFLAGFIKRGGNFLEYNGFDGDLSLAAYRRGIAEVEFMGANQRAVDEAMEKFNHCAIRVSSGPLAVMLRGANHYYDTIFANAHPEGDWSATASALLKKLNWGGRFIQCGRLEDFPEKSWSRSVPISPDGTIWSDYSIWEKP